MPAKPSDLLRQGLEQLGVSDTDRVGDLLEKFIEEIERWNPRFGLVKYAAREELVVKHVLDSLSAWAAVRDAVAASKGVLLDVGSGAGFPGIPLAIALPELSVTLLERMARRASFLRTCAVLLGLSQVKVVNADLAAVKGDFDVVTFRAVAPIERFLADIDRSGIRWRVILAYKGREARARDEIEGVRRSTGSRFAAELLVLRVPFLDEERCLMVLSPNQLLTNG